MVARKTMERTFDAERSGYESIFHMTKTFSRGGSFARVAQFVTQALFNVLPMRSLSRTTSSGGGEPEMDISVKISIDQAASNREGHVTPGIHALREPKPKQITCTNIKEMQTTNTDEHYLDLRIKQLEDAIAAATNKCSVLQRKIDVTNEENNALRTVVRTTGCM